VRAREQDVHDPLEHMDGHELRRVEGDRADAARVQDALDVLAHAVAGDDLLLQAAQDVVNASRRSLAAPSPHL
jgi:hypothetical protein